MELAGKRLRAALYARVSTNEQTCENQVLEIRQFCTARGWIVIANTAMKASAV